MRSRPQHIKEVREPTCHNTKEIWRGTVFRLRSLDYHVLFPYYICNFGHLYPEGPLNYEHYSEHHIKGKHKQHFYNYGCVTSWQDTIIQPSKLFFEHPQKKHTQRKKGRYCKKSPRTQICKQKLLGEYQFSTNRAGHLATKQILKASKLLHTCATLNSYETAKHLTELILQILLNDCINTKIMYSISK